MKIFNWVHKRFHHTVLKDGLGANVKTSESTTNGIDKQALLKQVALVDVLDGWRDGILTIGTLGLDPLKAFNQPKEYLILQSEEADEEGDQEEQDSVDGGDHDSNDNVEQEELNPLMFTTYGHNFEDFESNPDRHINVVPTPDVIMTVDGVSLTPFMGSAEVEPSLQFDEEAGEGKKKKGERITLADLFLADADVKGKLDDPEKVFPDSGKTPLLRAKNGLSFAKKFIPRVKEDSRPIKNLQRLVKRMLKRKIHPEFDVKMQKSDVQKPGGAIGLITNGEHGASESVTLLPTQGATV